MLLTVNISINLIRVGMECALLNAIYSKLVLTQHIACMFKPLILKVVSVIG